MVNSATSSPKASGWGERTRRCCESCPRDQRTQCRSRQVLEAPTVTKDGVSVAKEIELEDKFENMGAQMVKEVASQTSDVAGDSTTTATVLAQSSEGLKSAAGMNPMTSSAALIRPLVAWSRS